MAKRVLGGAAQRVELDTIYPVDTHRSYTLGTIVHTLGVPKGASYVLVQALAGNARYTLDGSAPTAAVGFQLVQSDPPILIPISALTTVRFIREAAGTILEYQYVE